MTAVAHLHCVNDRDGSGEVWLRCDTASGWGIASSVPRRVVVVGENYRKVTLPIVTKTKSSSLLARLSALSDTLTTSVMAATNGHTEAKPQRYGESRSQAALPSHLPLTHQNSQSHNTAREPIRRPHTRPIDRDHPRIRPRKRRHPLQCPTRLQDLRLSVTRMRQCHGHMPRLDRQL